MTRQEWNAIIAEDHAYRFAQYQERVTREAYRAKVERKRTLKQAHKDWLVNRALAVVIADNRAVYAKAQRMGF